METAVVVAVDAPALDAVHRDAYPEIVAHGIPLHVTLLYPWVEPGELAGALPRLAAVLARHEPFAFALTGLRTFPGFVWAAPEPAEPFAALARDVQAAFPERPHHGGAYAEFVPHMTLAAVDEAELPARLAALRERVDPLLPVPLEAREATVLVEDESGRWSAAARLPLGAVSR